MESIPITLSVNYKICVDGFSGGRRQRTFSVMTTAADAFSVRSFILLDSKSSHIFALSASSEIRITAVYITTLGYGADLYLWRQPLTEVVAHMQRV